MADIESSRKLMTDPAIAMADEVISTLAKRGLDVYYNPRYGVIVVGRHKGIIATKEDMDLAWAARHEIGLVYALRSLSGYSKAENAARGVIQSLVTNK